MGQPEARISRNILKALRALGYFAFKVHGSEMMMAGLPDIIVCARGLFIGIETKRPDTRNNLSPRQQYVHFKIHEAKGFCFVACSPTEAIAGVEEYLAKKFKKRPRV